MRRFRIRIELNAVLLLALVLLIVPLDWLLGAIIAASVHELGHICAIKLTGGAVHRITVGCAGAVMETSPMSRLQEFFCALAGPIGSMVVCIFARYMPKAAVCVLLQAGFNLLPVFPLDGGRMLRCLLSARYCKLIEKMTLIALAFFSAVIAFHYRQGILPMVVSAMLIIRVIRRKTPCKEAELGVQ